MEDILSKVNGERKINPTVDGTIPWLGLGPCESGGM